MRKQKRKQKNILDIAHKRTRRQVLLCYMSDTTWTRERKLPSRVKRPVMKARSRWSTSENKRMEKQSENVIETDRLGEELRERCTRTDEEAGSIVLHIGHDMNENEKNDRLSGAVCYEDEIMMEFKKEETNEAAAAKKNT